MLEIGADRTDAYDQKAQPAAVPLSRSAGAQEAGLRQLRTLEISRKGDMHRPLYIPAPRG